MSRKFLMLVGVIFAITSFSFAQEASPDVEQLTVEVLSTREHSPNAFTQGLLLHDGLFYESTGLYGESSLRKVDPETGEVLEQINLNPNVFAEGLALVDDKILIQLTWQSNIAFFYDVETFQQYGLYLYTGEGWGLCYDGDYLYMSSGSSQITKRDPQYFYVEETIDVTLNGEARDQLNELECVGDSIYANVYQTNTIVQIDKATGVVTAEIDASGLLTEEERANLGRDPDTSAVLNGIAYDEENDVFYITGKMWPKLFEVRFVSE